MDLSGLAALFTQLSGLTQLYAQSTDHEIRIKNLEALVATQQEVIARLNTVTNAYAEDTATIRQQIIDLRDAVTSGNQAAVSAALNALDPSISGLEAMETNLRGLGAERSNPVPDPVPPSA